MKNITSYILENEDKFTLTVEWMRERFDYFNKTLFNGELPHCDLYVTKNVRILPVHVLGMFTFGEKIAIANTNDPDYFQIMINSDKGYVPVTDITYIYPQIHLNAHYSLPEEFTEMVLIHEMIHLWDNRNGLTPANAHGRAFTHKAEIVMMKARLIGKEYKITATCDVVKEEYEDSVIKNLKNAPKKQRETRINNTVAVVAETKRGKLMILVNSKDIDTIVPAYRRIMGTFGLTRLYKISGHTADLFSRFKTKFKTVKNVTRSFNSVYEVRMFPEMQDWIDENIGEAEFIVGSHDYGIAEGRLWKNIKSAFNMLLVKIIRPMTNLSLISAEEAYGVIDSVRQN